MSKTADEFDIIISECTNIFEKKNKDYGTAWRILRPSSLTDQILIKASRIRSIQEKGEQKIEEDIKDEFIAIINYSVMAIIQNREGVQNGENVKKTTKEIEYFKKYINEAKALMLNKNHDYGEAWREMRVSSIIDIILMKIYRLKQIEDNNGKTLISEGPEANYNDMINYSIFAIIKINEEENKK